MAGAPKLISGYVSMWPREVFNIHKGRRLLLNDAGLSKQCELLRRPGVYVLYRDEHPHYVGQASGKLFSRLHDHANKSTDRYYHFWNFFSAFTLHERLGKNKKRFLDELEAILIAAMPTANSSRPKLKPTRLPPEIAGILAERRRIDAGSPRVATEKLVRDLRKNSALTK